MNTGSKRIASLLMLALTAALWSIGGLLIKMVNAHPIAIAGIRSAISGLFILVFDKKPKFTWSFPQIAAALSYALTVITFVSANKYTTAANAILIQYSAPIYVALFSGWLLKEKPSLFDWATIAVVFGGMALFFIEDIDTRGLFGNILAMISGVGFGLFPVFMRMQKDGSPIESVILGNAITAAVGIPFLFVSAPKTGAEWFYLLVLGSVQLGIPYILYSKAIRYATALEASLVTVVEPILNPVWVFLFLNEKPGTLAILGGIIVVAAVTIRCFIEPSRPVSKTESVESH